MMYALNNAKNSQRGVSLIEIMIVVAIIGILASIAIPSYRDYVVRTNRAEAKLALADLANRMEAHFSRFGAYPTVVGDNDAATTRTTILFPEKTENELYEISITTNDQVTYVLTATPLGKQLEEDSDNCPTITLSNFGIRKPDLCWR